MLDKWIPDSAPWAQTDALAELREHCAPWLNSLMPFAARIEALPPDRRAVALSIARAGLLSLPPKSLRMQARAQIAAALGLLESALFELLPVSLAPLGRVQTTHVIPFRMDLEALEDLRVLHGLDPEAEVFEAVGDCVRSGLQSYVFDRLLRTCTVADVAMPFSLATMRECLENADCDWVVLSADHCEAFGIPLHAYLAPVQVVGRACGRPLRVFSDLYWPMQQVLYGRDDGTRRWSMKGVEYRSEETQGVIHQVRVNTSIGVNELAGFSEAVGILRFAEPV